MYPLCRFRPWSTTGYPFCGQSYPYDGVPRPFFGTEWPCRHSGLPSRMCARTFPCSGRGSCSLRTPRPRELVVNQNGSNIFYSDILTLTPHYPRPAVRPSAFPGRARPLRQPSAPSTASAREARHPTRPSAGRSTPATAPARRSADAPSAGTRHAASPRQAPI